ncbi:hypothetical protein J5069_08030 [Candidatus Symbiopectobacterium sp. NZEC127]|uniref:hypothetical protein n=1 Tax=Candidatus Symbiopectobacterium sp. NZEC127 TaxID=2820472 RepID=UPI0022273CAA|nr:hypothetical protein [Candidatus Symbiopectobacterium sp. NZEC127]MCW2485839.1 hypothetical protein [Candidatus Symbiopectobacterium sp. NZEC127]
MGILLTRRMSSQRGQALRQQRIVAIDQALVPGMGPRVAHTVQTLCAGFYPGY